MAATSPPLGTAASLLVSAPALAATSPPLGTAASYTVLGTNSIPTAGTVTCTNTGSGSTINGDVGSTFTSITNSACTITGTIDTPVAGSVVTDFNNAYSALDSLNPTCDGVVPTTSTMLAPGVYCSAAGTTISAGVILTLSGSAADVWVFKIGTGGSGALTGNSFQVVMGGTAQACNVYWRTAEAATMTDSDFKGTLLAGGAITSTRGSYEGRALARTDVTVTDAAPMTFAGCAAPAAITVNKDFLPNSVAPVPVALTCTSGTVTTTPLNASEATPAVFTVTGASPGATCTATETLPAGYTADQTNCVSVALGGSCTITNTLLSNAITVNKDFLPNSVAPVPVALTCTSGTVTTTPLNASEATPAVFTVTGASPGATCTATETLPAGYTADQTNCVSVALGGSCTITNTLLSNAITVNKDFLPNSVAPVPVALTCTSGTVTTTPLNASEATPAVFTVTGASPGATCTATETLPAGYTADQTNCVSVALGGSCTITNTLLSNAITVNKDFLPNSVAPVPVALTCTSGTVTTTPLNASEATPAVFTVTGASPGATCTATETLPAGYTADQTNCVSVALGGSCTITNTLIPPLANIPTLSEWAMVLLAGLLALFGFVAVRRQTR
ncbi:MAG: IPTL-CTERM sorting domain-containing protein [Casimicrobiaceae bacterium]